MTASSNRRGRVTQVLADHKCTLIGWIIAWAAFTYAGAAVRWLQAGKGSAASGFPGMVLDIADEVPPHAKITFGLVYLLLLLALPRLWPRGRYATWGVLAGAGAGVVVVCLVPFHYFTGVPGSFIRREGAVAAAPHLLVAMGAGVVWAMARARCERRSTKRP